MKRINIQQNEIQKFTMLVKQNQQSEQNKTKFKHKEKDNQIDK